MAVEWVAVAVGIVGGAMALGGLSVLAGRKAAKTGERALLVFVWGLSFLSLVHGLGLCLVTAAVWAGAPLLVGPIPEPERQFMGRMILAGVAFVVIGAVGLRVWRRPMVGHPTS
jgi:hypothetical protein